MLGALATPVGELRIEATARGIAAVVFDPSPHASAWNPDPDRDPGVSWPTRPQDRAPRVAALPEAPWQGHDAEALARAHLRDALEQLAAYFEGARREFDLSLDLAGTEFEMRVWRCLATIPFGETRTYAQIASAVGRPNGSRAAGAANGRNPVPILVPCHRVVGTSGSLVGFGGGIERKRWLLDHESGVRRLSLPRSRPPSPQPE